MTKKKQSLFWWIAITLVLFSPLILLCFYVHKLESLSCIDIINKVYLLLGVIGIFTYWVVEWVKREER